MKTKRLFFIATYFIIVIAIKAGSISGMKVSGKILDRKKQDPVQFADVMLMQSKDSIFVKHTMTDDFGNYQFDEVKSGDYFIKARLLGYQEKISPDFKVSNIDVKMEQLSMEENSIVLQEAVVTEKKRFVEQQADKMVINPEATITTASDNVLDVLAKSPGVNVDKDGNISIKGKSGITILIDDKPTYLSTDQLAAMLKNLQASSVQRIEIMENPPAKYDAEGSSGVINIRTKKGQIRGLNGSVSFNTQVGDNWKGHGGLDLNYRNEKWNIYGNYWGGFNNNWFSVDLTRKFPQGDNSTFYEYTKGNGQSTYNGLKLGADYYLSENHVIGIMARGSGWNWDGDSKTQTHIMDAAGVQQSHEDTNNNQNESGSDWTVNMNYKWTIDSLGRNLSADLDYAYYPYISSTDMNTVYTPTKDPLISKNKQSSYTNIYSFKVDYSHPFNNETQLDAGLKSSLVTINSDLAYKQLNHSTENWDDPMHMSNQFKYTENINAAYLSFKYKWNKSWDMQVGLRGEQTRSEGNNVTIDSITKQNYFNLFPTVFLQKTFSPKHQVNLSYAYRIGRPNYWLLNPFIWMLNPYTYNQGNPLLQPQFTHSLKLGYTFDQKYILSLGYAYTKDQYTQVFEQNDETKVTIVTWRNFNTVNNADVTLTIPVQIKKWCQINANMTTYYMEYKLPLEDGSMTNRSKATFRGNIMTTFSLPKAWSVEVSGWYMSPSIYGSLDMKSQGGVDAGIQKRLFKDKATIKLGITDIFQTMGQNYTSNYRNLDIKGIQKYDSRRLQLNFTWRFGQDNLKPARQRSSGLEEEAGRAGK